MVARKMAGVRTFFKFLVADGILRRIQPIVDFPPVKRRLPLSRSPAEGAQLLLEAGASDDPRSQRDAATLEIMYATGMRASEVIRLRIDSIDLDEATVRCIGKGDKERILPLNERAALILDMYLERGRRGLLKDGECETTSSIIVGSRRADRGLVPHRQSTWRRSGIGAMGRPCAASFICHSSA